MRVFKLLLLCLALFPLPALAKMHFHDHGDTDAEWLADSTHTGWKDHRASHREVRTVEAAGDPATLHLDGSRNGGAMVHAGAVSRPKITARIQSWARTRGEALAIARQVRVTVEAGVVSAEGPEQDDENNWSVIFNAEVRPGSNLVLEAENGPVSVEGVHGTIEIRSGNGPVSLERVGGNVSVRLRNGPLEVVLDGSKWEGEGLDAQTVNGPVSLSVPKGYSAVLETGTVNGPLTSDLPMTRSRRRNRWSNVTLGSGGAKLRIVTTNGPAWIREVD